MCGRDAHLFFESRMESLSAGKTAFFANIFNVEVEIVVITQQMDGFLHAVVVHERGEILLEGTIDKVGQFCFASAEQVG